MERDGACGHKRGCHLENGLWITPKKEIIMLTLQFCIEKNWKQVFTPSQPLDSN